MKKPTNLSRRGFLTRSGMAGLYSAPVMSSLLNFRLMNTAAAAVPGIAGSDYKALVCVFLAGGNDSFNMLIPRKAGLAAEYRQSRGNLALADASLLRINHQNGDPYGLHPSMPEIQSLYNSGKAAFVANVGTLVNPTTLADYHAGRNLPVGLFSHKDQIQHWQTSLPQTRKSMSGWAGRVSDMLSDTVNRDSPFGLNLSINALNIMQKGQQTSAYVLNDNGGANTLNPFENSSVRGILGQTYENIFSKTYAQESKRAISLATDYTQAVSGTSLATPFPNSGLGTALKGVARSIASRVALGMNRQIFFVQIGGFDHHDDVLNLQHEKLTEVSAALGAFQASMDSLLLSQNVTTFTASDFGRSLSSNSDGSDHGWGGNAIVMGGAVDGGKIYGNFPQSMALGNPLDTGRGRFLPTTSVDEFNAELAMWFGIPNDGSLENVLPNIRNFFAAGGTRGPMRFLT